MGEPIGMLAFDATGRIRGALIEKGHRGIQYGHNWLPEIIEVVKQLRQNGSCPFDVVNARIHKDNPAPLKVVLDSGFTMVETDGDFTLWEYRLNDK